MEEFKDCSMIDAQMNRSFLTVLKQLTGHVRGEDLLERIVQSVANFKECRYEQHQRLSKR
jgi:hypothetical protein